ncbi:DUF4391 domain-containing protein [Hymenobacter jeollabukensis]|uniref:DUF4391 domain-containing protein n=1 Tax=Hymenobacter jeollabukensis TaxID=2025313 RepID=A0A5R8WKD1_9BACT|nr:DUF4391 domain-containing protein [Hymenobacter jeollabukensis]TLM88983.1 DUF4391 domain-containing protein [Hymenobacter jeollabukensis]
MSITAVYAALGLPAEVAVDERVPKKVLLEQVVLPAPDRRLVQDGLEELRFLATLKPSLCGVAAYHAPTAPASTNDIDVIEVVVVSARLRPATPATTNRLLELLHRAIPYPMLLLAETVGRADENHGGVIVSLAHKRPAQNAADRLTLLEVLHSEPLHLSPLAQAAEPEAVYRSAGTRPKPTGPAAYLAALTLPAVGASHLSALYQSWLDRTVALAAANITGNYCPPTTPAQATALREALAAHSRLKQEQVTLRSQAAREKQMARRASLNLRLRQLDTELVALHPVLTLTSPTP